MRVAFFVNRFPMLSEQFITNQMTGLLDRGHELDIYAALPGDDVRLHPDVLKYRLLDRTHYRHRHRGRRTRRAVRGIGLALRNIVRHPSEVVRSLNVFEHRRSAASLDLLFTACALTRSRPYDIAHFHFGQAGLFGVRLRQVGALTGRLVTTFYGTDVSKFLRVHGPEAYGPLIRHGDLFICITDDMRHRLAAAGFPPERIGQVPLGIDLREFRFRERSLDAGETIRLLTVGRLVEKKGHDTAIRAVAQVVRWHPNLRYQIVGDGPMRGSLERLIALLGVERWIELSGWKSQEGVRECFDKSHLFVLASQTAANGDEEGMPQVLKEAQAMGLPVVSTRHSGIGELVLDGRSGFLVAERDAAALADRLRFLIEHPAVWPAFGCAGRRHVEDIGDMNTVNDALVEQYRRQLTRGTHNTEPLRAAPHARAAGGSLM